MKGVLATRVGYLGGHQKDPDYESVCSGKTGHTEVVELEYDPKMVSYDDLVHVFWNVHDPTFPAKTQYQSVIFYHSPQQEEIAKASKERIARSDYFQRDLLTQILPVKEFFAAEDYHQRFLQKRDTAPVKKTKI